MKLKDYNAYFLIIIAFLSLWIGHRPVSAFGAAVKGKVQTQSGAPIPNVTVEWYDAYPGKPGVPEKETCVRVCEEFKEGVNKCWRECTVIPKVPAISKCEMGRRTTTNTTGEFNFPSWNVGMTAISSTGQTISYKSKPKEESNAHCFQCNTLHNQSFRVLNYDGQCSISPSPISNNVAGVFDVKIIICSPRTDPTPTPTKTPTPTPSKTPTPSPTVTGTPPPTPTATTTPSPSPSPSPSPTVKNSPTATPTGVPNSCIIDIPLSKTYPVCQQIKIYKNGQAVQPSSLLIGETVDIAVSNMNAIKVRVSVNNGPYTESSQKNTSGEFIVPYTLSGGVTSYIITAQVTRDGIVWY